MDGVCHGVMERAMGSDYRRRWGPQRRAQEDRRKTWVRESGYRSASMSQGMS